MELGYLCFGNPRGEYPVDRDGTLAAAFFEFLEAAGFKYRGFPDEGPRGEFLQRIMTECTNGFGLENDVFMIRPYDWDPVCTCGFEERQEAWEKEHGHRDECYYLELGRRQQAVVAEYGVEELYQIKPQERYNEAYERHQQVMYDLCDERKLPREGCAVHCTCAFSEELRAFHTSDGHAHDCRYIQPNFRHKPSGFELSWYKYPLRSATINRRVKLKKFKGYLAECLASLVEKAPVETVSTS